MKTKIFLTIFAALAVLVSATAYKFVHERYFSEDKKVEESASLFQELTRDVPKTPEAEEPEIEIEEEEDTEIERDDSGDPRINRKDCDSSCDKFKENKEDLKFCRKLCGIFPVEKKEERSECENLQGSEKDFCIRDLAVTKKDFKICDEIKDKRIKDACNDRIIEEMFDGLN